MQFVAACSKILFGCQAKVYWWHHHTPWYYTRTSLIISIKRYIEKKILKKIDVFLANSHFLQKQLKDIYGIHAQVLYPAVDDVFLQDVPKTYDTLVTYGRWVPGKNLALVLRVIRELRNAGNNCEIHI